MEKRWIANPNVKEVDFLDIRIEKTERAIKQAFMELRAEKPLEKIRVKELCDRACTENIEQAIERAGTKAGNKGYDCAVSAIEMVNLLREMDTAAE